MIVFHFHSPIFSTIANSNTSLLRILLKWCNTFYVVQYTKVSQNSMYLELKQKTIYKNCRNKSLSRWPNGHRLAFCVESWLASYLCYMHVRNATSYYADLYTVSRCWTSVESEEKCAGKKVCKWEIHPGFETQGRCHQNSKTRVSAVPQKGLVSSKNVLKKELYELYQQLFCQLCKGIIW